MSANKHAKLIAHAKAGHASGHRYCLRHRRRGIREKTPITATPRIAGIVGGDLTWLNMEIGARGRERLSAWLGAAAPLPFECCEEQPAAAA